MKMVEWKKNNNALEYYKEYSFENTDLTQEYFTLPSSIFKTSLLREANFKIQENTSYVDCEYILFPIPFVKTLMFTNEHVYRYAIGNPGQSVSIEIFVKRYSHHDRVVKRLINWYVKFQKDLSPSHRNYIKSILVRIIQTHYDLSLTYNPDKVIGKRNASEFDQFLKENAKEFIYEKSFLASILKRIKSRVYKTKNKWKRSLQKRLHRR